MRILVIVASLAIYIKALPFDHEHMTEKSFRQLDELPEDISVCDEFFFGRVSTTHSEPFPFCVNNGVCKSSWVRQVELPCDCLDGFAGPHCEFTSDAVPSTCHLDCRNEGKCKIGAPTWQHYYRNTGGGGWTNPLDLQHCSCPAGYTGILCELKGTPCGDSHCHHGGKCVESAQDDGSVNFHCDCSSAKNSAGDVAYAGEYCEHEATSFCTTSPSTDHNGNHFCVNGGSCQAESYLGCTCQEGYVGPLCEFEDRGQEPEPCNLTCQNHGICREGAKDVSILKHEDITEEMKQSYNQDFEHCVCPSGYVGLQCEYQLDQCPGGAHVCLNGGECITAPNGTQVNYLCDCSKAETDTLRYAGAFCEMESTQFCTIDHGKSHADDGLNAFCTNGGTCRDFVPYGQKHPGCACSKGFGGENCQYHDDTDRSKANGVIGGLFVAAGFAAIVWLLLQYRRRRIEANVYGKKSLPPTLDIIRSLGHDREAEYTNVAMVVADKSSTANAYNNYSMDDNIVIRKTYWPSASYDGQNAIQLYKDVADDEEIRFSRKTYWPNDSHNDASNPIHIFDEISVKSDVEDSINNFTVDDDDNDDSTGISSYDHDSRYKTHNRII